MRSKKAPEGATEARDDGNEIIQEFQILAANWTARMDELTPVTKNRHVYIILNTLQRLQEKSTTLCSDITELKTERHIAVNNGNLSDFNRKWGLFPTLKCARMARYGHSSL